MNEVAGDITGYVLYPNPTHGDIVLTQYTIDTAVTEIDVVDVAGRSVYSTIVYFSDGKYKMNITGITPGMYMLQLTDSKKQRYMFKFVKQ